MVNVSGGYTSATDAATVADATQRRTALDPQRSFIVQAPAGSGKTSLLTQRYLTLLAYVQHPEEIVAITFTRKAAAEMRNRIIDALNEARAAAPDAGHEHHTWELARTALMRDEDMGWNLLAHPARLRIHTIDALCNTLTRQMPVLSSFGAVPSTTIDAAELYRDAARETLALLESEEQWSPAIESLLQHLDNDLALVEGLLATMLARRDQWLRHVIASTDRAQQRASLENALHYAIKDALADVRRQIHTSVPPGITRQFLELARFAASHPLPEKNATILALAAPGLLPPAALVHPCTSQDSLTLPGEDIDALPAWLGIATLLLTDKGTWRMQADKNIGFPAPDSEKDGNQKIRKEMKQRFKAVLTAFLQSSDGLRMALDNLRRLPPAHYSEEQWRIMEALLELLPVAVAQLQLVFRARGQVDFSEVAQRAVQALGSSDNPTDLALALDYRIQHLLVDEFQDTSFGQYQLLERLTAGWQPGDGRTLFVVGDPMQSIYRFREAEVGLFLRARERGVGALQLEPLTLSVNFRSQAGIVEWVNHAFADIFPGREDMANGAVTYSPSTATHAAGEVSAVQIHPFFSHDALAEAAKVVALVQQARATQPSAKIAVLVRARSHLTAIVAALQVARLRYRAIEIENLGHRPVVQDLLALTRALLHPADRIAWLAVLRAPWCGLMLADLHALAGADHHTPVWDLIVRQITTQPPIPEREDWSEGTQSQPLSPDGQRRLTRLHPILRTGLAQRRRQDLRRWIEGIWLALGGPACVEDETDLEDAEVFFDLLTRMQDGGDIADISRLEEQITRLFALPDVEADELLQLMTIHKAKGLEFDTVIVPGLSRRMPHDENRLLIWIERPTAAREEGDLLLAPIKAYGQKNDPIYTYLKYVDQQKGLYETGRLLYVAATRAKKTLHLLGHVTVNEEDGTPGKPPGGSFLSQLWPVVEVEFVKKIAENSVRKNTGDRMEDTVSTSKHNLRRLVSHWEMPDAPAAVYTDHISAPVATPEDIEFLWASDKARHIGTVVHRVLRHIAQQGVSTFSAIAPQRINYQAMLLQSGVSKADLDEAVQRVEAALRHTLNDERGRWVLDNRHHDAHCEYALTGLIQGKPVSVIIDRTFVDAQGTRWIIDYKTGSHEGADISAFLDSEQIRYRGQLEKYAALMQYWDKQHAIRLGLYFPLLGGWREWKYHS